MHPESPAIDPVLSNGEREELRYLEYLSARVKEWLDRGLISPESCATIDADGRARRDAIERHSRYQAAIARANALAKGRPAEALSWAEQARELEPDRSEPWSMAVDLSWTLERDDEAVALCALAAARFPHFEQKQEVLRSHLPVRAERRRLKAEQARREQERSDKMATARLAMRDGRDSEAVDLCREVLSAEPRRVDALQTAAYALQRLGRLDEAIALYESLATLEPSNSVWSQWLSHLRTRRRFDAMTGKTPESAPTSPGKATDGLGIDAPPPRWSWSSFAAEFLEEHWQKLILCLAVLLIVVSSTVGAHVLLGPMLWQPAGKCALALIWTILFAALGAGLIRWGAERAGQMMLVATLIVVPIHFMLAGELKLVTQPSASGVIVAAVDGLALIGLVRAVAGMLVSRPQARFLTAALLLLSVGSVATARGVPVAWGWQFAAFQSPALVFLGAVGLLGLRRWGDSDDDHRHFAILMLGLLGFAFLACTIRIGAYAMRLEPALYAVPVMLGAIAAVNTSRRLAPYDPDVRRLAWIRFGGYVLTGLAFALALSPPRTPSAIFSANTVAASLLGFALYAAALRRDRHPAFLYLAIAALVAGRVGAHYFLAERIRVVIDHLRRILGYSESLPWAYLSLLGLIVSPALAGLSLWFRRGWKDERLARHCHFIGLPLALAACLWSCQEPKAAAVVLSGYAVLFTLAVWLLAVPWITYPAIAAVCGAAYFGSTLIPGLSAADQALIAVVIAWVCLAVGRVLARLGAPEEYGVPWVQAYRVLSPLAFVVATAYITVRSANSPSAAAVFLLAGTRTYLGARERPRALQALLVLLCFVEFTICGLALSTGGRPHPPGTYGLLFVVDGLVLLAVERFLSRRAPAGDVFPIAIARFVIALTLIADFLAYVDLGRTWVPGLVWLLGAPAILGTTRRIWEVSLVYLGLTQLVAGVLALSHWSMAFGQAGLSVGWLAVSSAVLALILWSAAGFARRRGVSDFYVAPTLNTCLGLTAMVLALAIGSRLMARDAYRFGVLALVLNAGVTILLSATWHRAELTYAAILHLVVASYVVLFSVGNNDPRMAFVLGLAAVIEAIVFWGVGFACDRVGPERLRPYALPFYHATVALTLLGIVLADRSAATMALAAVAFLLTVKSLPRIEWLYAALASLAAACYFRWLSGMGSSGVMASLTAAAFACWAVGCVGQMFRTELSYRLGLRSFAYESPLFHSSIVAASIAVAIRASISLREGVPWTGYAWFPLAMSLLALLMLKAYPRTGWVHASMAFLVYGVVSAVAPSLSSLAAVALAGSELALGLYVLERAVRPQEETIDEWLSTEDSGHRYLGIVRIWSGAILGAAAAMAMVMVLWGMAAALGVDVSESWAARPADWWMLSAALVLAAGSLVIAWSDPASLSIADPARPLVGLHALGVVGLWWLTVPGSPLARLLPPAGTYYPLATALAAVATIHLGRRFIDPVTREGRIWTREVRYHGVRRAMVHQAYMLSILAIVFTGGKVSVTTVVTMLLAALATALAALMSGWALAAGLASIAWAGAWSYLGALIARSVGLLAAGPQATWAAWGSMASAFSLWALAGTFRRGAWTARRSPIVVDELVEAASPLFARVIEGVASATGLMASAAVLLIGVDGGSSAAWVTFSGVGVLLAAGLLHVALVPRWRSEWPVYIAQILMVGAYVDFRLAFPMLTAADAVVLTLLGYLDLAIAEALERLDRAGYYTRPTRYASLVLPLLPLLQLLRAGSRDDISLFYLAAAATFYATACGRLRWKTLGYAAAVFANAALWLLWSRVGWRLAEHPQFYFVPVGLSAILFAEVNRELGRAAVNAIRSVGLIVIYVSLAMPIWHSESFGAWLTLLLASLLGIFIGIGLRLQTFLWLGLTTFVLDVLYEMGRMSLDHATARWAIMLALGLSLLLFVALNEKKRILSQMLGFYAHARTWE